ncbi:MAG: hypothetical protein Q9176_000707 [Flavoplaca citrina]
MSEITHPTIKGSLGCGTVESTLDLADSIDRWMVPRNIEHVVRSSHDPQSEPGSPPRENQNIKTSSYSNPATMVLSLSLTTSSNFQSEYQEMITHLAMNSHPNPQRVLVIGGGDGGVLQEVVKHSTVETAIVCDIDESVIRLSKKYLPGMSIGFQHPNVSVHVGDGFKFLADRKNEFDVIITDSSDPEGPAESLFEKPYFELLHGALREGGVITTQEPTAAPGFDYAAKEAMRRGLPNGGVRIYDIPDIPSKDAERNVKVPLRSWDVEEEEKLCRYYNQEIHRASFVLPSFARKALR